MLTLLATPRHKGPILGCVLTVLRIEPKHCWQGGREKARKCAKTWGDLFTCDELIGLSSQERALMSSSLRAKLTADFLRFIQYAASGQDGKIYTYLIRLL
jgi:hypothetical protein